MSAPSRRRARNPFSHPASSCFPPARAMRYARRSTAAKAFGDSATAIVAGAAPAAAGASTCRSRTGPSAGPSTFRNSDARSRGTDCVQRRRMPASLDQLTAGIVDLRQGRPAALPQRRLPRALGAAAGAACRRPRRERHSRSAPRRAEAPRAGELPRMAHAATSPPTRAARSARSGGTCRTAARCAWWRCRIPRAASTYIYENVTEQIGAAEPPDRAF